MSEKMEGNNMSTSSARTQEAMDAITSFYNKKIDTDYEKIIDMIENGGNDLTRRDFINQLGIDETVLDSFFNLVVRGCDGDERDAICDRLISINRDDLGRIVKRLKNDNIHLEDVINNLNDRLTDINSSGVGSELVQRVKELEFQLLEKEAQIQDYVANGNFSIEDVQGEFSPSEEYSTLLEEKASLIASIEQLKMEIMTLEEKIVALNHEIYDKDIEIAELKNKQNEENTSTNIDDETEASYKTKIYELENEKEDLLYQLQSLNHQNDNNDEIYAANERIQSLQNDLVEKGRYIERLEEEANHLNNELNECKSRVQEQDSSSQRESEMPIHNQEAWEQIDNRLDLGLSVAEETTKKSKGKMGLWIIGGVLFALFLALVGFALINTNNGPVQGVPTPIKPAEKITGAGLSANVSNGAATELPPVSAPQTANTPVVETIPTTIEPMAPVPSQKGITKTLLTPNDFRKNVDQFSVSNQGLTLEGQVYKVGDSINGFRIVAIQKNFVRLLDIKNDLEFRLDIGA